ncbi:hypothetical protein [Azospirillum sp. SYSU D00513]|uniref:hypothetical protein n=1 Tax=Azospirillum sp. SYSU D00513 TaxID=2812561 RepID=UPI001A97AD7D|nr:hypothetical protein [Azospirillum sp. SYSU D00513]
MDPMLNASPFPGPNEDAPIPMPSTDNPDLPNPGVPGREAPLGPGTDLPPMTPTDPDF